jgi:hypothetical protein
VYYIYYSMQQQHNFKATQILFLAQVAGPSIMLLITLYLKQMKTVPITAPNAFSEVTITIVAALLLPAYLIARYIYNNKLKSINHSNTVSKNWECYRQALIVCAVIISGITILNIIFFMLQAHKLNFIMAIAGIFSLISFMPNKGTLAALFGRHEDELG